MKAVETREPKPIRYVLHALIVFSLLGLEYAILFVSRIVDGRPMAQVFSWPINWYGAVAHWTLTMLVWGTGAWLTYRWAKQRQVLPELVRFGLGKREVIVLAVGLVLVGAYTLIESQVSGVVFPQVYREYVGFRQMYGAHAWITSIWQNLYYLFEFVLVIMIVAFFQRAGELWFANSAFPWGSIGLLLTWGSIHLLSHPQGALGVMIWSLVPGIAFVLARKSFLPVLVISMLGFVL